MEYKAVIFDLDGVICQTDRFHYQAWKKIADQLGVEFDEQINSRLRGVSRMQSLEIILEKYPGKLTEADKVHYAEQKNEIYRNLLKTMTPLDLQEEVRQTLYTLRERKLKLAIGSSSKNAKFILQRLGLQDFFDAVSDGTNITKSKPDPEVFQKAAAFIAVKPCDCLVVEDAEAGICAAKKAGMGAAGLGDAARSVWVDYPLESFQQLEGLPQLGWMN